MGLLVLVAVLSVARAFLPWGVRWYVNRALDRSLLYRGEIGEIDVHLLRGAYSIQDIRLFKVTGNVPVPFFAAKRLDLSIQPDALVQGAAVGRITMVDAELNFVAAQDETGSQTGAGAPWMQTIQGLFPFKINSARIVNGAVHFRAFDTEPPVDVYLSHVDGYIDNLTNIYDETKPLVATVKATALAMEQAKFQFEMKLNPFSYRPTFQLAVRLLGLDVRKINSLTEAYGEISMERGWFDLVIQLEAVEGRLDGYVKPLFRNLKIFSLKHDLKNENLLEAFWQALVGLTTELLENKDRNQFGTVIPFSGEVGDPRTDIFTVVGNVLRNAFIRAYLPRFRGTTPDISGLEFGTGSIVDDPSTMEQ